MVIMVAVFKYQNASIQVLECKFRGTDIHFLFFTYVCNKFSLKICWVSEKWIRKYKIFRIVSSTKKMLIIISCHQYYLPLFILDLQHKNLETWLINCTLKEKHWVKWKFAGYKIYPRLIYFQFTLFGILLVFHQLFSCANLGCTLWAYPNESLLKSLLCAFYKKHRPYLASKK